MSRPLALLSLALLANVGHASCGSAFCSINSNWDTQGIASDTGASVDLRYSYSKADQWRAGSSRKQTEEPGNTGEEIENKHTINQILNANIDYALSKNWSVMLGLPFVMRDHTHTLDPAASDPVEQQARFNELGDIRVLAKFRFDLGSERGTGIRFGMKLPTGATNKAMTPASPDDPTTPYRLERSSQPGTGSTDAIFGAHYYRNTPGNSFGWFVSGQIQAAVATKDQFRPGNELTVDTGIHYEVAQGTNLLLQLNAQHRARDTGSNANPASGGYSLSLSPGISYAPTHGTQLYAFVQQPIVRYVNTDPNDSASGQLSARWSASLGLTQRF